MNIFSLLILRFPTNAFLTKYVELTVKFNTSLLNFCIFIFNLYMLNKKESRYVLKPLAAT